MGIEEDKNLHNICVYIHRNKINGKIYIGQTKNIKKRWGNNGAGYKESRRFWNAIQKYGWENFEHEIIKEQLTREEANKLEKKLIKQYNSTCDKYGYNISSGGFEGFKHIHTEEEKKILSKIRSEKAKELWQKEDYRQKQEESRKEKLASAEYRDKLRQNNIERYQNEEEREKTRQATIKALGRKILCVELNMVFDSITLANEFLGKPRNANGIYSCLSNKSKTGYGYHWKYLTQEEYYDQIENNSNK